MEKRAYRADLILLAAAVIWGCAFAFQKQAAEHLSTFSILAIRFALGAICLFPIIFATRSGSTSLRIPGLSSGKRNVLITLAGVMLCAGAFCQQYGLEFKLTTAGKAGFITGLYVVIVPIIGLLWKHRPGWGCWLGVVLAVVGLYYLSVTEKMTFSRGDAIVLVGAFIWAGHVQLLGYLAPRCEVVRLACLQYAVCSAIAFVGAIIMGDMITLEAVKTSAVSLLYLGLVSTATGFTLQALGQKDAPATHAAIIMSMETVFAAIAGFLFLAELLNPREILGCVLMLSGMLVAQLWKKKEVEPGDD